MVPCKGAIESKVYKLEGGKTIIDDITEYFLKMDRIEQTQYELIKNKEEFVEKSRLFYNFISKFEGNGYSVLYDAIQKFKTRTNLYKRYGKFFIIEFL